MAIQKIQTSEALSLGKSTELNLMQKFNAFADAQEKISIVWWLLSLILIGGFFLPLTFLLVYSLGGPTAPFLAISMISFFACIVANMGGMGIRMSLSTFFFSVIVHVLMIATTLIAYV